MVRLPGLIAGVMVAENQRVEKGEALLILEAMKMQNEIQSPMSGIIKKLFVNNGESVMKDQFILELEIE